MQERGRIEGHGPSRGHASCQGLSGGEAPGLLLAALGIYGILAYHVARRTPELGLRRGPGATAAGVIGAALRRALVLAAWGSLLGLAVGAALAMAARRLLFGIEPLDPLTFAAVPALLIAVALVAGVIPALRAISVEASEALRAV